MESSIETEARAGAWLAKREGGRWSAEDQSHFTQWLNASMANRVAYLRQEAAWEYALRLHALKGATPHGTVPTAEDWKLTPFFSAGQPEAAPQSTQAGGAHELATPGTDRRGRVIEAEETTVLQPRGKSVKARHLALAASVFLTLIAGLMWEFWARGPVYSTPVGGIASVPISDGSKITLNTASEILVSLTDNERRIDLRQGEAFFEIAPDPTRPFVVSAADRRIIVLGTKFSVKRESNEVRVVVAEGRVAVLPVSAFPKAPPKRADADADLEPTIVPAGSIAHTSEAGLIVRNDARAQVDDYLSWRTGYLVFHETPLAEAVAEFNRYNEQQIAIQDPVIAALRFSGKIRPSSFEPFIRLLEDSFPIKAQHDEGNILLTAASSYSSK